MKHLFVPYEIALQLKEKGFDEECFGWYWLTQKGAIQYSRCSAKHCVDIPAPLYQQVIDWFREKYNINFHYVGEYNEKFTFIVTKDVNKLEIDTQHIVEDSYYEALQQAIEEALKLI